MICGLRTAPEPGVAERQTLHAQLLDRLSACEWFTVGVMAANADQAIAALRQLKPPWDGTPKSGGEPLPEGGVFLKGNQRNWHSDGACRTWLGVGNPISGQAPSNPDVEETSHRRRFLLLRR